MSASLDDNGNLKTASKIYPVPIRTVDGSGSFIDPPTSAQIGTQGTGSSYDPPPGGSGLLGYESGIYRNTSLGDFVIASNGVFVPVESLAKTLVYTNHMLDYVTVVYNGTTYKKSYTYTSGDLTSISSWVAQ